MFIPWLIGFIVTSGLIIAYIRKQAKRIDLTPSQDNMLTSLDWNDSDEVKE